MLIYTIIIIIQYFINNFTKLYILKNINLILISNIIEYNDLELNNFSIINKNLVFSILYDLILDYPLGYSIIKLILIYYIYKYKFYILNDNNLLKIINYNILIFIDIIINFIIKKVFNNDKINVNKNLLYTIIINNIIFIINLFLN